MLGSAQELPATARFDALRGASYSSLLGEWGLERADENERTRLADDRRISIDYAPNPRSRGPLLARGAGPSFVIAGPGAPPYNLAVMGLLACSLAYAALGASMGLLFARSAPLRSDGRVQVLALILTFGCGVATLAYRDALPAVPSGDALLAASPPAQGYVFLCAAVCHVPGVVYILLSAWNRLLERLTNPGRRPEPTRPASEKEEWRRAEELSRALASDPIDPGLRRSLAETYLRLGHVDAALGELRRAAECAERGYEQASLLHKTARLLIDTKGDTRSALPVLRRLVRQYPRSYFAAYARRVMNQYDAHVGLHPGARGDSSFGYPPRDADNGPRN